MTFTSSAYLPAASLAEEDFYLLVDRELRGEVSEEEVEYLTTHLERWRCALTEKLIASEQHLHNLNTDLYLWRREYRPLKPQEYSYDQQFQTEKRMILKISATNSFITHVRRRLLHIKEMLRQRYHKETFQTHWTDEWVAVATPLAELLEQQYPTTGTRDPKVHITLPTERVRQFLEVYNHLTEQNEVAHA